MKKWGSHVVVVQAFTRRLDLTLRTYPFQRQQLTIRKEHGSGPFQKLFQRGHRPTGNHVKGVIAVLGAQSLHGITPDLTTMGKVIGGGMPLAAFGGRKDIMECISPLGGVYQAGTLSGNPIAVAAGLKTLEIIQREGFYENLTARTEQLVKGFQTAAAKAGVAFTADSVGGMFGLYFAAHAPQNYGDMARSNIDAFKRFFHGMLDRNTAFGPSAYEAGFVSAAHTPELIDETIATAHQVFAEMAK